MSLLHPSSTFGLFVVLEGIDGSGTTTQLANATAHLRGKGRSALATREPSTGPVGRLLREILLGQHAGPGGTPVDGRTMALLFAADRRDHLAREVEPALAAGTDVVSDRYVFSSLAYQAVEADRGWVERLAEGVRVPDLTLFLDTPVAVAADRRRRAGRPVERYDGDLTLEQVAENYRRLVGLARLAESGKPGGGAGRVVTIDGAGSVDDVARAIAVELDGLIAGPKSQESVR